jgi:D-alanine-D-alanine ligase
MKKINIAILTGGDVAEREISLKSANTVFQHLDEEKYQKRLVEWTGSRFIDQLTGQTINLNNFKVPGLDTVDVVYLILHGHPAEDGEIQGYFRMLGIPYTGCGVLASSLTFNKQATKDYLKGFGVPMAESKLIFKGEPLKIEDFNHFSMPLFVKPNKNGSSYGVTKVKSQEEILSAIEFAFQYDEEVMVEEFMEGREFSNGVFRQGNQVKVLPITEIKTNREFFDYQAKYENQSQEITPAELSDQETFACKELTGKIYQWLGCKGMCRVDYILSKGKFKLLEINTIPGMSQNSIIPQQIRAQGLNLEDCLNACVEEALSKL